MIRILRENAKTPMIARFDERQFRLYGEGVAWEGVAREGEAREGEAPAEPIPRSVGASLSRKKTMQVECYLPFVFSLILGLILTGCNKSAAEKETSTNVAKSSKIGDLARGSDSGTEARSILEACIAKYKGLKSYEDVGVLRIDNLDSDSADRKHNSEPMRIAFEARQTHGSITRNFRETDSDSNGYNRFERQDSKFAQDCKRTQGV